MTHVRDLVEALVWSTTQHAELLATVTKARETIIALDRRALIAVTRERRLAAAVRVAARSTRDESVRQAALRALQECALTEVEPPMEAGLGAVARALDPGGLVKP